jgi:hypothetical protein
VERLLRAAIAWTRLQRYAQYCGQGETAMKRPKVSRGTKPFPSGTNGFTGGFPRGFLLWLRAEGWLGLENICWLCSGGVKEPGFKVDVRAETKPDLVSDATKTNLPPNQFDYTVIDPPYSRELAKKLYGTEKFYSPINEFVEEAVRITRPGGNIITLSYEPPRIPDGCDLLAVWGVYQFPLPNYMRCLCVFRKRAAQEEELAA